MRASRSDNAAMATKSGAAARSIRFEASLARVIPSPPARRSAAPSEPPASFTSASRSSLLASGRSDASSDAISASLSGRSVRRWQRERMVGKSRPGVLESSSSMARDGGSSSNFKSALAALSFMSSALSTITTRQPPAPLVMPKKPLRRLISSTPSTVISLPSLLTPRLSTNKPGCEPALTCTAAGSLAGTLRSSGP